MYYIQLHINDFKNKKTSVLKDILEKKGVPRKYVDFLTAVTVGNYGLVRDMIIEKGVNRYCYENIAMKIAKKNKYSRMLAFLLDKCNSKQSLFKKEKLC